MAKTSETKGTPDTGAVKWEDPPSGGARATPNNAQYAPAAAALRTNENRWGLVADGLKSRSAGWSLAKRIKDQKPPFESADGAAFEAVTRRMGDTDTFGVYARYVPATLLDSPPADVVQGEAPPAAE